jgi:hypothetical protein
MITTSEQAVPGPVPIQLTTVETAAEQRTSEQVPLEAPVVDHTATEERRVPEPEQESPEQSAATPSTQEGVLPDAVARGKTPVVLSELESSLWYADAEPSRRQEEAEAGQQQEQPKTADAAESDDNDVLEEIQGHPRTVTNTCMCAVNVGISISSTRKSPQLTRQKRSSWQRSGL